MQESPCDESLETSTVPPSSEIPHRHRLQKCHNSVVSRGDGLTFVCALFGDCIAKLPLVPKHC